MENTSESIQVASNIIDSGKPSDDHWRLVPAVHATQFEKKAPLLAKNLRSSRCEGTAKQFQVLDDVAVHARDKFKKYVGLANLTIFITAVIAALLLICVGLQGLMGDVGFVVLGTLGVLGIVFGGIATMLLVFIREGELSRNWAQERAKAEAKRLAYFKEVMVGATEAPMDQLLAFEYTRRFLLDEQIKYFRERGKKHEDAASKALQWSTIAMGLASILTALAGALVFVDPLLTLIAGVGAILSAFAAMVNSWTDVNRDSSSADYYRVAREQLEDRRMNIDIYRKKVESEGETAVEEFFEPVFVTLQADHKLFLDETTQREYVIGDMSRRLDTTKASIDNVKGSD